MTITFNGKPKPLQAGTSVTSLLNELDLDPSRVAVEINRDIVPRERFDDTTFSDGDQIEVVQFVGGG